MADAPVKDCPKCGEDVRRLINGGMGVIFRGSGFYVTDKNGGSSAGSSKEQSSAPSCASSCPAADSCPKAASS
jgi:predicted nucleic acid-binding Zn ribbon protein